MTQHRSASIRAKLKQYSDKSRQNFDLTLTRYGLERLLYRLSISEYKQNFVLKGALLFLLWYDTPHRPTRDADLLGFGTSDINSTENIFREICHISVDDGIIFNANSVKGSEIRKEAGYGGIRIDIVAILDSARITLQVDIGYGDVVTPEPETVSYPVMLSELPGPTLRAYPKYTVVAEKFHAICLLGMSNSRMKDYFDLWMLLRDENLEFIQLQLAIEATFQRRGMPALTDVPLGLTDIFASDTNKQIQWRAFLNKNKLEPISLHDIVKKLRDEFQKTGII